MKMIGVLFLTFAKIGLFTFGGGYAMIAVIENICVNRRKWLSHQEMMDILVIAESTPGPIAINCATFVGFKMAGVVGSIFATLGVVLPSFVIILFLSSFFDRFLAIEAVANAFVGIKVAVGILIFNAGFRMFRKLERSVFSFLILFLSFGVMLAVHFFSWNFSSISMILAAGAVSLLVFLLRELRARGLR